MFLKKPSYFHIYHKGKGGGGREWGSKLLNGLKLKAFPLDFFWLCCMFVAHWWWPQWPNTPYTLTTYFNHIDLLTNTLQPLAIGSRKVSFLPFSSHFCSTPKELRNWKSFQICHFCTLKTKNCPIETSLPLQIKHK